MPCNRSPLTVNISSINNPSPYLDFLPNNVISFISSFFLQSNYPFQRLNMDDDGFVIQSRRRGARRASTRDRDRDDAPFLRDVPRFEGTSEEFNRAHARRYGAEEGLGPDGSHRHGYHFPHGSDRERLYTTYSASTMGRNTRRDAYQNGLTNAEEELQDMSMEEQEYYRQNTGGLPPHQHARLDPRAREWSDISYR